MRVQFIISEILDHRNQNGQEIFPLNFSCRFIRERIKDFT